MEPAIFARSCVFPCRRFPGRQVLAPCEPRRQRLRRQESCMYLPHHGHVREGSRIDLRLELVRRSSLLHWLQVPQGATLISMMHRILIADAIHEQAHKLLASRSGFEVAVATGLSEAEL